MSELDPSHDMHPQVVDEAAAPPVSPDLAESLEAAAENMMSSASLRPTLPQISTAQTVIMELLGSASGGVSVPAIGEALELIFPLGTPEATKQKIRRQAINALGKQGLIHCRETDDGPTYGLGQKRVPVPKDAPSHARRLLSAKLPARQKPRPPARADALTEPVQTLTEKRAKESLEKIFEQFAGCALLEDELVRLVINRSIATSVVRHVLKQMAHNPRLVTLQAEKFSAYIWAPKEMIEPDERQRFAYGVTLTRMLGDEVRKYNGPKPFQLLHAGINEQFGRDIPVQHMLWAVEKLKVEMEANKQPFQDLIVPNPRTGKPQRLIGLPYSMEADEAL